MVGAYANFQYGPSSGFAVEAGVDQVTTTTGKVKADADVGTYVITTEVKAGDEVLATATYILIVEAAEVNTITLDPATGEATVVQGAELEESEVTLSSNYNATGLKTFISLKKGEEAVNFDDVYEEFNLATKVGAGDEDGPYNMVGAYANFQYGPSSGFAVEAGVDQVTTTTGKVKADADVGTYVITTEVKAGDEVLATATYTVTVEAE